jgi:16S rRNA (guanine527-N7)-methyltransferase
METARIAELLAPFIAGPELPRPLLEHLRRYLDLLLRWNARMNLSAVRDPEQIVTRHFGESLFAAHVLLEVAEMRHSFTPASNRPIDRGGLRSLNETVILADVGSGAGFPGIPMKLLAPQLELTLIESQSKKATFLREVIRVLGLERTQVFCGRAEQWGKTADLVTLRAVERFSRVLPVAAELVATGGKLCLLIGADQIHEAQLLLGADWIWQEPNAVPQSRGRVVLVGRRR